MACSKYVTIEWERALPEKLAEQEPEEVNKARRGRRGITTRDERGGGNEMWAPASTAGVAATATIAAINEDQKCSFFFPLFAFG